MKLKNNSKKGILHLLVCFFIFLVALNTHYNKVEAASNVSVLIKNLGGSTSPLLEYSDPITYAEQYSKSLSGKAELFLVNWSVSNLVTTKNQKWKETYEQELLTLLSDNTIIKACLEGSPTEYVEAVDTAVSDICEGLESEISEEFGNVAIASNVLDFSLKYGIKQELRKNQAKMQILVLIAGNTKDRNLQAACQSCIKTVNTTTFNKV